MKTILITLALLAGMTTWASPADAAPTACYVAPTHSARADHCRAEGWILRDNLRVDPHNVISFTTLRVCSAARSTYCAVADGQSDGPVAWVSRHGVRHAVWPSDPRLSGRRGDGVVVARWLTAAERRALATEYGHAPRWWNGCTSDLADGGTVRCADGSHFPKEG